MSDPVDQLLALANATESKNLEEQESNLCDDPELIQDFLGESREHLGSVEQRLLELEQNPQHLEAIHATFRSFHTIKGLAGFLGFNAVQQVAHETETLLDRARSGLLAVTPRVIDAVLRSADYLKEVMTRIEGGSILEKSAPPKLLEALSFACRGESLPETQATQPSTVAQQSEPAVTVPQSEAPQSDAPPTAEAPAAAEPGKPNTSEKNAGIRVDAERIEYLIDMVGELVIAQSMVRQSAAFSEASPVVLRNLAQLSRATAEVQKTAMSMRMAPVAALFQKMSRVVRDVARKSGKKVSLVLAGEGAEMDRKVLDGLAEPLMHMVRNAVDHGLETPPERLQSGKSETGTLRLRAEREAGNLVIEISDDGRGLNANKIRQKAVERGLIKENESLSPGEIYRLIFEPGFSTAEKVTEFSGRGVGMDVVRRQVESLRGRVEISSTPGAGSIFTVRVPLTLATVDGLLIRVGQERYILPTFTVKEILRASDRPISTIGGQTEMMEFRNATVPVVRLAHKLRTGPSAPSTGTEVMIVVQSGPKLFCLIADEVVGKEDVVIKSLGTVFRGQPGIAGGAILGDGRVGLILDLDDLLNTRLAARS